MDELSDIMDSMVASCLRGSRFECSTQRLAIVTEVFVYFPQTLRVNTSTVK